MKKILLLVAIAIQTIFLFGQIPMKGDNSLDPNLIFYDANWGNWTAIPNSSISFTAKLKFFDKIKNMYGWNLKFKTNKTPVYFEFKIKGGYYLGSDEIDKFFNTTIFDNKDNENRINGSGGAVYSRSNTLTIAIRNVCFDFGQDRSPKCQKLDMETSSSSGTGGQMLGNNQTETVKQQYNNTVNRANTSLQTGNYTGAMQNYADAAKSATTKSEKQLAAVGAITSGVGGIFDAIAKAKAEKLERERLEAEQLKQKQQAETAAMEANWQRAQQIASQDTYNAYSQAINIMLSYANANKINGMALTTIGFWYWKQKDYKNAMKWYEASADKNNSTGMFNIGVLYNMGQGVEKNKIEALNWFNKACKAGYNDACSVAENMKNELKTDLVNFDIKAHIDYIVLQCTKAGLKFNDLTGGSCITETSGSNRKSVTVTFLKGTAKIRFTVSMSIGTYYSKSLFVTYEDENLKNDLSTINLPKIIGSYQLGKNVKSSSNNRNGERTYYYESINLVEDTAPGATLAAAFKGSNYKGFDKETAISKNSTVEAYLHNVYVSCTDDDKIKWYEKAVEVGDTESLVQLEWLYLQKKMYQKAFEYFTKYADKNTDAKKIEQIAEQSFRYTGGYGTSEEKNYNFLKVQKIADMGNASAIYYMAQIYQGGFGTQKDYGKAVDWYNKSAENNNATAMCAMSKLYDTGGYGLEKNKKLSKEWRKKSVAAGGNCK